MKFLQKGSFFKNFFFYSRKNFLSIRNCSSKRIFSGIQPTGSIHLGNYFGAIRLWEELQDDKSSRCIYSIVDMHAISLPQKPEELQQNIKQLLACLLACGIDPSKAIIMQQSKVPEHTQLAWILGCITTIPRLERIPQFKEKSKGVPDVPLGLFVYPVLQAADILLYKTTHVPVGDDQEQNLELVRDLSEKFNKHYLPYFIKPQTIKSSNPIAIRVKSLRKPEKKMSKSDNDQRSRINIVDSPDVIIDKCKKAVTDFTPNLTFDPENRPGVSNLISIHSLFTGLSPQQICDNHVKLNTGQYKLVLAEIIIEALRSVRVKYHHYISDELRLNEILTNGNTQAREIASQTLDDVMRIIGFKMTNNSLVSSKSESLLKH